MFNPEMHSRALKYRELIRPLLTVTRGDVPFFFVLPNSQPIDKITNVARILQRRLGIDIPTATMVRKMGATAVARNCSEKEQHLVARQMNHDMQTCRDHYQAVVSDKDAVSMYTTIRHLREIPVTTDHETDPVTEEPSKTTRVNQKWTSDESKAVLDYFSSTIERKGSVSLGECSAALASPHLAGVRRTPKQLQDKVRTAVRVICRKETN